MKWIPCPRIHLPDIKDMVWGKMRARTKIRSQTAMCWIKVTMAVWSSKALYLIVETRTTTLPDTVDSRTKRAQDDQMYCSATDLAPNKANDVLELLLDMMSGH